MTGHDLRLALEAALGDFLSGMEKSVAKSAHETAETARAMGIASQQLRRIADVMVNSAGTYAPARFALIDEIHGGAQLHLLDGDRPILYPGDRVRILAPTMETRHYGTDYLEVAAYDYRTRIVQLASVPHLACHLDWLEWYPLRTQR